jgi:ATP-binding cassette subfamily B protein
MLKTIKRLLEFSGAQKSNMIQSFIYCVIFTIFEALPIAAIIYSLNSVITAKENGSQITMKTIIIAFLIMLIHVIGKIVFGFISDDKNKMACFNMCAEKRIEIGDRLKRMPMGYFSSNRLGEIASAVTTTINDIEFESGNILSNIVVGLVHAVLITIMISFFDWRIGIISICAILLGVFVNNILQSKGVSVSSKRQEAQSGLVTGVLEYIQGMAVIKSFGLGEKSNREVDSAIEESYKRNIILEETFIKLIALYQFIFKVAGCAMIIVACYLLTRGQFTLSSTLMIIISSFVMYSQIEVAGSTSSLLNMMNSSMDKIDRIDRIPFMDEKGRDINTKNYTIEFKNVSFSYDSRKILDNINLKIRQNTTVAILGPSGGGKTTLCNLIARFWDVDEGKIMLGGYNVKEYTFESLLKNISMVFQNVYLFKDTILNNIKFGRPEATMEEVIEAAKKACCHGFISELSDGYNTMIGEGGCSLSGGEKQRISIARAILKDAPIIILDEATSSVDPENEKQLHTAIEELTKNRTVIMIAHRLSTVKNADNILVLNKGHIVEEGKHEELIRKEGIYSEFIKVREKAVGWSL